jgi:UrcA family protein
MKKPFLIILSSALATGAVIKAAPALAEPVKAVSVVRTADLDLSTNSGRKALDHRLVIAVQEVCGTASDVDLAGKNAVRQCRTDALGKARARGEQLASRGEGIVVASR